jgi:hypothetical protein
LIGFEWNISKRKNRKKRKRSLQVAGRTEARFLKKKFLPLKNQQLKNFFFKTRRA